MQLGHRRAARNAFDFPLSRCRWLNEGESLDAGDRSLAALQPPLYDSPATGGLLDQRTGVYWAADAFPTPAPGGAIATSVPRHVSDLDQDFWSHGMAMFTHHALSPLA